MITRKVATQKIEKTNQSTVMDMTDSWRFGASQRLHYARSDEFEGKERHSPFHDNDWRRRYSRMAIGCCPLPNLFFYGRIGRISVTVCRFPLASKVA